MGTDQPQHLRWRRAGARLIDSAVGLLVLPSMLVGVGLQAIPPVVFVSLSVVLNLWYLASDRFPLGKRLMGLAVVDATTGAPCTLNQSLTRNATFGGRAFVTGLLSVFGVSWAQLPRAVSLSIDLGLLALALYEASKVDKGLPRLGDRWAGTKVIDTRAAR